MDLLHDRRFLCASLCFVYRMIVASAPLLKFAIERSDGDLRDYYEKHLAEETGHDEMAKDDLRRLGVLEIPRVHRAAQIAGSQYYLIAHDHPALLLGYMHVLERNALRRQTVEELCEHHSIELTMYRHHAAHDEGHSKDIKTMMDSLDEPLLDRVEWNERSVAKALHDSLMGGFHD